MKNILPYHIPQLSKSDFMSWFSLTWSYSFLSALDASHTPLVPIDSAMGSDTQVAGNGALSPGGLVTPSGPWEQRTGPTVLQWMVCTGYQRELYLAQRALGQDSNEQMIITDQTLSGH